MGYSQHPQPMLSSEVSQGSGLLVPYTAGGSSRLPLRTPWARQVEGDGWGESTAILPQLPQGPQFHQRCAGTPQVTLNTSSLVDAALQGIQPHHVKVTFVTHLSWLTGLGSSCNPKASPRSPPTPCSQLLSSPCTAVSLKSRTQCRKRGHKGLEALR